MRAHNPLGNGECHLFLAGNRVVLLGNRLFSWQEITTIVVFEKEVFNQ